MAGAVSSSLITYHVSETLHGHLHAANEDLRVRGLCERVPFIRQLPVFSFLVVFVHLLHQVLPVHKLVSWPKPFQSRLQVLHNHVRLKRRKRELRRCPNGLTSRRKSTEIWKTRTCVRTCDGWPNGFANRLASSRKSQKVVNFAHIQLTCDQLLVTCAGDQTVKNLRTNLSSTKVNASQHKWVAKRNSSRKRASIFASPFG